MFHQYDNSKNISSKLAISIVLLFVGKFVVHVYFFYTPIEAELYQYQSITMNRDRERVEPTVSSCYTLATEKDFHGYYTDI